jgi:nitrite reductase/ring-hydroxylating ferredoxin subunit
MVVSSSLAEATSRFERRLASRAGWRRHFRRAAPRTADSGRHPSGYAHAKQAIGNRCAACTIDAYSHAALQSRPAWQHDNRAAEAGREERLRMAEKLVGKISEFKDGDRRIVFVGDHEIGVFRENGAFYAYSNYCLHQGGPACEGLTIAKVEERIMPDKTSKGLYFSDTELHFVCPWHGYEYDIKTGECVSDRKLKLRKYEVIEKGDEVYVRA